MSRKIDLSKPLSAEDRAYLEARGQKHLILQNERQFPDKVASSESAQEVLENEPTSTAAATTSAAPEDEEWVNSLTVEELKDELSERDEAVSGNKSELQARLLAALAAEE